MERLLKYLESHFCPTGVHWTGQAHHLTKIGPGRAECAFAIMHMIFERWLPVIELVTFTFGKILMLMILTKSISIV